MHPSRALFGMSQQMSQLFKKLSKLVLRALRVILQSNLLILYRISTQSSLKLSIAFPLYGATPMSQALPLIIGILTIALPSLVMQLILTAVLSPPVQALQSMMHLLCIFPWRLQFQLLPKLQLMA